MVSWFKTKALGLNYDKAISWAVYRGIFSLSLLFLACQMGQTTSRGVALRNKRENVRVWPSAE